MAIMRVFLGYFVWGLILAVPLAWLVWRIGLLRRPGRIARLPEQLEGIVIHGKRWRGQGETRR
ncbi:MULTISPECIES: hypothetical protein [unclassified Cupriavidus]|uniref:hypothetical protein n=1 Tax=Cupriavidus TaxID=106589 RepID=UPI00296B0BB1|nr:MULTISPECIES: hypothetical protein [unclassified Cupriavidus]